MSPIHLKWKENSLLRHLPQVSMPSREVNGITFSDNGVDNRINNLVLHGDLIIIFFLLCCRLFGFRLLLILYIPTLNTISPIKYFFFIAALNVNRFATATFIAFFYRIAIFIEILFLSGFWQFSKIEPISIITFTAYTLVFTKKRIQ